MDFFHCSEDRCAPSQTSLLSGKADQSFCVCMWVQQWGDSGKDISLAGLELKVCRLEAGCQAGERVVFRIMRILLQGTSPHSTVPAFPQQFFDFFSEVSFFSQVSMPVVLGAGGVGLWLVNLVFQTDLQIISSSVFGPTSFFCFYVSKFWA